LKIHQRLALRLLFASRKNTFLSLIATLAVLSVMFGVAFLLIVLAVMEGFEGDFREKILGFDAHVVVQGKNGIADYQKWIAPMLEIPGIAAVSPFVQGEVLLSAGGKHQGALVRGVDPTLTPAVLDIENTFQDVCEKKTLKACFETFADPGVLVGSELAQGLHLFSAGKQQVTFLSPMGVLGPFGFEPQLREFRYIDSFRTGYYDYDTRVVLMPLKEAQAFFGNENKVSGFEIKAKDADHTATIKRQLRAVFPNEGEVTIRDWKDRNQRLFSALLLEKIVMFVVLCLIILVASFLIFSTLSMLVSEKYFQIAVLRTLGFSGRDVLSLFLFQGGLLGIFGVVLGLGAGLLTIYGLDHTHFVQLPSQYYSTTIPVKIRLSNVFGTLTIALGLVGLGCWYPSTRATKIRPVEVLRHE